MNALGLLRTLGPVDLRNIRRDPLMAWALGMALILALVLRWGIPALSAWLLTQYAFDFAPYLPLIAGGYLMAVPSFVGFVVGFLLLDERDDGVFDAMRVTPVSLRSLLTYRIGVPLVAGVLVTALGYTIAGLAPLPVLALVTASALAAFGGPIQALFLVAFAENKVSGFAMMKLFGAITNLPIAAWFLSMPWHWVAGLMPSFWPMKVVWQASAGQSWAGIALVGLCVNGLVLAILMARFRQQLTR